MAQPDDDAAFENLIRHIQESRGVDFRGYKRTSLRRRVALRMEHLHLDSFLAYHDFLQAHPQEFVDLLNTVLINVTSFFRDPDAWDALKTQVLPKLVEPGRGHDRLRIWSVGCASGEEPYSLAMLMCELLGPADFTRLVKIYATDLDEAALNSARHAAYLPREMECVPSDLLQKYFERTNNHYVVTRDLRKAVIFGRHNIVHDAPISRIDLLVCRNLLIYLETETQNMVLPRLHYSLMDDGYLFLGKAETQLARSKLFQPINMKQRLFRKTPQEWRRIGTGGVLLGNSLRQASPSLHTRLLDAIVDNSSSAYLAIDSDDQLIFASAGARRMLEVGESDIGRPFRDLAVSYRPTELRSRIDEVRRQTRPLRLEHQEYHRPPANPIRVTIDVAPLVDRDGRAFAGTADVHRDLANLRAAAGTGGSAGKSGNYHRGTAVRQRGAGNHQRGTAVRQRGAGNHQRGTAVHQRRTGNHQRGTPLRQRRAGDDERGAAPAFRRIRHLSPPCGSHSAWHRLRPDRAGRERVRADLESLE